MSPKTYPSDAIDLHFELGRCIHAGRCVHGSPEVFDPKRKPWIDPTRSDVEVLVAVVEQCPTGALSYTRKDGGAAERGDLRNSARLVPDGPLQLRGRFQLGDAVHTRAALCRCGASQNKPFCDNAHRGAGFSDDGLPDPSGLADVACEGEVQLQSVPNGPLHVVGDFEVVADDGDVVFRGSEAWLCRCGASANKPFCDGSHRASGFEG